MTIAKLCDELDERQAYLVNARVHLADVRSMVVDYLSNESDQYIKAELIQEIDIVDGILKTINWSDS